MIVLNREIDLNAGPKAVERLNQVFAVGNADAHTFRVRLLRNGADADISGDVQAYVKHDRDNSFEVVDGMLEGSTAVVTLAPGCYSVEGHFTVGIMVGQVLVYACDGMMTRFDGNVFHDPENRVPGIDELLAQIDAMEEVTTAAQSATSAANTAAQNAGAKATAAQNAAGAANTAAGQANTAAGAANTAAQTANTAAQKIDGMTVSATGLTAGSNPTAVISEQGGAKHVAFGIPKGDKGDKGDTGPQGLKGDKGDQGDTGPQGQQGPKGDTGATPDISIGTVTTGAPGTDASATMTGTPEAPVLSLTIPRGMPGEGNVLSVAGVMPDEDGDVPLSAADVGALASGGTAANASKLGGKTLSEILLAAHPVGCIYQSLDATSPAAIFGGTWEQFVDRFLVGAGASYAAGSWGGEAYHTLSVYEMPSHNHGARGVNSGASSSTVVGLYPFGIDQDRKDNWDVTSSMIASTGGNGAHNNMPPYLAVYMWRRVS